MNNQVIKLRANSNHFGHPVTSHDHPAPALRQPMHAADGISDGAGQAASNKHQAPAKNGEKSEEPHTTRRLSFTLKHPSAKKVQLAAEFTEWEKKPLDMTSRKGGEWKVNVVLPPGRYKYRFLVDGQWQDDPNAPAREANPFGTCDCVAEVK